MERALASRRFGSYAIQGAIVAVHAEAPDAAWQRAWQINVMSHVYVARAVLPRWLENGGGRLLFTGTPSNCRERYDAGSLEQAFLRCIH